MIELTFHTACLLFPQLPDDELRALADDIRLNGLLNPIITLNQQILDGRNRYLACGIAGVEPRFKEWDGGGSPTEWVISENLFRRHLTASQKAVVAFGMLPLLESEAKERQRQSAGRGKKGAKQLATSSKGKASEIAARIAHSNSRYIETVKAIHAQAPELVEEVRNGTLTVPDASEIAKLPQPQRAKALALMKRGGPQRKVARIVRQVKLEARSVSVPESKAASGKVQIWCGDCVKLMAERLQPGSVSVVVTSPPFNVGVDYGTYDDDRPEEEYLGWLADVFQGIKRVLRDDGSFFLTVGGTRQKPWTALKVAQVAGRFFVLQNEIVWVKAIAVEGRSHGHFSPISGCRYLNHNFEWLFHFTKNGDVKLDRLAVGVPYQDQTNLLRNQAEANLRCRGDVWFIPHVTIHAQADKGGHPCVFPVELAERCIKLHGVTKDSLVLDPFSGSGTTMIAAEEVGVAGIGIDISQSFCGAAIRRLGQSTRPGEQQGAIQAVPSTVPMNINQTLEK